MNQLRVLTDEELLHQCLLFKIVGVDHPNAVRITEVKFYNSHPIIHADLSTRIRGEAWYFYSQPHRIQTRTDNFRRVTAIGWWLAESPKMDIAVMGCSVGGKKEFRYHDGISAKEPTGWIMTEYTTPQHEDKFVVIKMYHEGMLRKGLFAPTGHENQQIMAPRIWKLLPKGFRFQPTDIELIEDYLMRKALNTLSPSCRILEIEFYTLSPEDIESRNTETSGRQMYFFSHPKREKVVGVHGRWSLVGKKTDVKTEKGSVIGNKISYRYHQFIKGLELKTKWYVNEYTWGNKYTRGNENEWVLIRFSS